MIVRWVRTLPLLAALPLLVALAGCAVAPIGGGAPEGGWAFDGRLSVVEDDTRIAGHAHWQHSAARDELQLRTPLGQTVARIVRDAAGVTLETPDEAPRTAADAETLTREVLGVSLPVAGLAWWVRGQADPARPAEWSPADADPPVRLRQDGWTIDYQERFADGLPRKLDASRGTLTLRLIIDQWATATPTTTTATTTVARPRND